MAQRTSEEPVTAVAEGRLRSRWTRLAALGLLVAALAPIIFLLAGLITGLPTDELPFFIFTAVIGLVAAALVRRFGTWAKVVGIVAALLMGMALFWTVFSLGYVSSFVDFTAGVCLPLGVIVAIVAGIAAIVRRRTLTPQAVGAERHVMQAVLAIVAAVALVSGVLNLTTRGSVGSTRDVDLTVAMFNFEFDKTAYETDAGKTNVLVRNSDAFVHTFTIDELNINDTIIPGGEKLIAVDADPGSYILYCVPHTGTPENPDQEDMAAQFVVGAE